MANLVLQALRPTPTGAALLAVILYTLRNQLDRQLSWSKALVILLLFLNRGSFPLRWHLKLFWIALRANLRYRIAALGYRKPNLEQKKLGIKGGDLALGGVGRNYMDIVSTRNTRVSFAESDYNLHLSNSNYAQAGDFARMQFASDYVGVAYSQDGILTLLGGSSFCYLREIPMFAKYSTESRTIAYDDKWCYFLTRFIIPYDKRTKRPPSKSYETGKDCTVCAFLLSRLCFKRGRLNVSPEKVFTLAGMVGPDDANPQGALRNWNMVVGLRKKRGVRDWIQREDDRGEYIRGGKEQNDKAIALIAKLHDSDRKVWLELDALGH